MKRKSAETFTKELNGFVERMKHHVDVMSVKTRGHVTTITYESYDHPKIINTTRKKLPGELGYSATVTI